MKFLRENIVKNREKFELGDMIQELEGYDETLKEHYNQSIM